MHTHAYILQALLGELGKTSYHNKLLEKQNACRQEVLFLDNEIAFNEAIIEEREQGIKEIEDQIGQANEIFRDLAVLVHEQGVVIGKFHYT